MSINYIRWGWVLLCFGIAAGCSRPVNKTGKHLLAAAMGLTVIADFFLLITPYENIGIATFAFAHVFHIARNTGRIKAAILLPCVAAAVALAAATVLAKYALSAIYAACLITAFVTAITRRMREKNVNNLLLTAGFALFICCDITVALFNTVLPQDFMPHVIWAFYAPSQLLIALSIYKYKVGND